MSMLFWEREHFSKDAVKASTPQWLWSGFYQGCANLHNPGQKWVWNSPAQIGLISKGLSNIYYRETLTFSNFDFLEKKIWRNAPALKRKKVQGIFGETFIFGIIVFSCLSSTNLCLRFLLICFAGEIKGFYQSSLKNEVDFTDIINVSPKTFWNPRHGFVDERAMITTTLTSSCHWKTLVPFCLWKKRPEKSFLTLTVNYCRIVPKNILCHSKQQ